MSRLDFVTIAIVTLCVAALAILIVRVVKLTAEDSNDMTAAEMDDYDKYFEDGAAAGEEDTYSFDEAAATEEEETPAEESSEIPGSPDAEDEESDEVPTPAETVKALEDEQTQATKRSVTSEPATTLGVVDGAFMVIAGSFSVKNNAEAFAEKLRGLGYTNVETGKFNKGTYTAVLVDRYNEMDEAKAVVRELKKQHNISAYVQKQLAN